MNENPRVIFGMSLIVSGARYKQIIREEKLYELMEKLYHDQLSMEHSDIFLLQLLKSILHLLKPYRSDLHQNSSAVAS